MEWLTIIAKALGLADWLSRFIDKTQAKNEGVQEQVNADLTTQAKQQVEGAAIGDWASGRTDAELDGLLEQAGAGRGQPGVPVQVPAGVRVPGPLDKG